MRLNIDVHDTETVAMLGTSERQTRQVVAPVTLATAVPHLIVGLYLPAGAMWAGSYSPE